MSVLWLYLADLRGRIGFEIALLRHRREELPKWWAGLTHPLDFPAGLLTVWLIRGLLGNV